MTSRKHLPRHDLIHVLSAGPWLAVAAIFFAIAAAGPYNLAAAVNVAAGAASAAIGIRKYLRARKSPETIARRELLAVLRSLPEAEDYLNRDRRVAFKVKVSGWSLLRVPSVIKTDEDEFNALLEDRSGHIVVNIWHAIPGDPRILRQVDGTKVNEEDLAKGVITFPHQGFRWWFKGYRAERKAGVLYAPAGEIRELTELLEHAEPMGSAS